MRGIQAQRVGCLLCGAYPCRCPGPPDVLSAPRQAIAPLHEHTEHWRRGARPPILLPCVCEGPDIRAMSGSQEDIADAVRQHQIEPVHIAYDEAHGIPLATWQRQAQAVDAVGAG